MTEKKYTSAGRLLSEVHRIRNAYEQGNIVGRNVERLFSGPSVHWSSGLSAYAKLSSRVLADVYSLPETRRNKFIEAIARVDHAVSLDVFPQLAPDVSRKCFGEIVIERLESMDELLSHMGKSVSIDQERAGLVGQSLDEIIREIEEGDATEIDDFLKSKLSELRFILDNYALYGPDGVRDAVSTLIGRLQIEHIARGGLSEGALKNAKGVWRVAKGMLDTLVYGKSGVEAIEWAGHGLGLLEG